MLTCSTLQASRNEDSEPSSPNSIEFSDLYAGMGPFSPPVHSSPAAAQHSTAQHSTVWHGTAGHGNIGSIKHAHGRHPQVDGCRHDTLCTVLAALKAVQLT